MSRARQDRVLAVLLRESRWLTAASLADTIGVTPRSIRTYVTSINARTPDGVAIESGPFGYRAGPEAGVALRAAPDGATPRDRVHRLVRLLLDRPDGLDTFDVASSFHISDATVESDLARVRAALDGSGVSVERRASTVYLRGPEVAQRRVLSRLVHEEMEDAAFDPDALRRALGDAAFGRGTLTGLKSSLAEELGALGYVINEFGIADAVTHIAIAADRVARDHALTDGSSPSSPAQRAIGEVIARLVSVHLGVHLGAGDVRHLASLVRTRVVVPGEEGLAEGLAPQLDPSVLAAVADVVARAAEEFLVDIDHPDFVSRLALHVQNLRERAAQGTWSRNMMTRSLKLAYPLIFDVAVYLADGLRGLIGADILDDEIAYLAMHVGGRLEQIRLAGDAVTVSIVSPGYYEVHELLRASVARALGPSVEIVHVETRVDPEWTALPSDLVLTTIDPGIVSDRFVRIQPFLTAADIERIQRALGRVRRARRLGRLRAELERYFSADAFETGIEEWGSEEDIIRRLGERLIAEGIIDEDYVERAVERERMSSTAFTDALAVPHAMGMTATRTAIAVGIADGSVAWGDGRVQVVALVAFSESDREAFQTVFEQLVEVFSERESVQRIVRRASTFAGFMDELVAVVDG